MPFSQVKQKLGELLNAYGTPRSRQQPELPFWHLRSDGLWEIPGAEELDKGKGGRRPLVTEMERAATGGFRADIDALLRADPQLLRRIARMLLDEHFPTSYHEDLITAVGLDLDEPLPKHTARDPAFRQQVLNAYGYRCAVCGLDPLIDGMRAVLEASHLQWHSHGGPSTIENGICLCPLHHKGLDLGVIGISDDRRVLVSSRLHGGEAIEASFGRYHQQSLIGPFHGYPSVHLDFVKWHTQQVFRNPPRR